MIDGAHHIILLGLLFWQEVESVPARIWRYINHPFTVGNFQISAASIVIGVAVFVAAIIISRSVRSFMQRRLVARAHLDPGIQYTVLRLIHYLVIAFGVLLALKTAFNLDLTTLAVVFTALSVGIGFGLQFIAGDIASGFILLFERPVRVGDFITINEPNSKQTEGRVQSINLRTTIVMTNDHIAAIIPNSKLVNQNLINWSYGERRSRIAIPVGVAYESDVELVTRTLEQAAGGVEYVLEDPKPRVQFLGFGDYSLDFRLLIWTNRPRRHVQIRSDIYYRIHRQFKEAKIEVPFPRQDLHVSGDPFKIAPAGDDAAPEDSRDDEANEESSGRSAAYGVKPRSLSNP